MERGLINLKELIIGERIFRIPIYQRNYSWEQRQLEDLWNDLVYLDPEKKHYFGTILLRKSQETEQTGLRIFEVYDIIDGQQRITTILILLKELIEQFKRFSKDPESQSELLDLERSYLRYKTVYKLVLLGDDAQFFRNNIIDDKEYPDEILTASQRRLREAKRFFRKRFEDEARTDPEGFMHFLTEFKKKVDNLELIRYPVDNDSDAVLIFETVNDRGKVLSRLEKTKSFLMHQVYLSEPENPNASLHKIDESFSRIFRCLEQTRATERGRNLDEETIQRYHFVIYEVQAKGDRDTSYNYLDFLKKVVREKYLENKHECLDYVLEYTNDLEKAFFALLEIVTSDAGNTVGFLLDRLFVLDRPANFFPLLIAAWIRFKNDRAKMTQILQLVETFVVRAYVVAGRRADMGETKFYSLAHRMHSENLDFEGIVDELRSITSLYENDESFQSKLKRDNFYDDTSSRDIRYLLFEYEGHLMKEAKEPLEINLQAILSEEFTIEHIWPETPTDLAPNLKDTYERCKHRLGNLTIASRQWNSQWGNKPFAIKKTKYSESSLRVQRELSRILDWGEAQIDERATDITRFALSRWRT